MNQVVDPDFDELGARLGRVLRSRVDASSFTPPELEPVRAGARRRRSTHRAGIMVVCVALLGATGFVLTTRGGQSEPSDQGDEPIVRPAILPAFGTLDPASGIGQPFAMWTSRGGEQIGVAVPRIDVWQSGDKRLVIRTVDNSQTAPSPAVTSTIAAPPTTAATSMSSNEPWVGQSVTAINVRGTGGAIEELDDLQHAVWIPTGSAERYTLVIGRGMARDELLAAVESLVEVGGVLQPPSGFSLADTGGALPATTPGAANASVSYGFFDEIVGTYVPPAGHSSLETSYWTGVGRLIDVDGREVMFMPAGPNAGTASATWIDDGMIVYVGAKTDPLALVRSVRMVSEAQWVAQGQALSAHIAESMPAIDSVSVGDVTVTRRLSSDARAICVTQGSTERCVARQLYDESPESVTAHADINGRWVIFGYRQVLPDEELPLTIADVKFTSADGSCCTVQSTQDGDGIWYVVHVDDDVDLVDTNVGYVFGGLTGSISRPIVASSI